MDQVRDVRAKYNYFSFSRDIQWDIIDLFIFISKCDKAAIKGIVSMMTFERDNRKRDSANLSQVGRNISDIFNARLSSWWHVLYTLILDI